MQEWDDKHTLKISKFIPRPTYISALAKYTNLKMGTQTTSYQKLIILNFTNVKEAIVGVMKIKAPPHIILNNTCIGLSVGL